MKITTTFGYTDKILAKFSDSSLLFLNILCGAASLSPQLSYAQESIADVYFWEFNQHLGVQEEAKVKIFSYVKHSGTGLNRKTTAKFAADAFLFGKQISNRRQDEDIGQIVDLACHLNEGTLSSYTYLRVLGETKYQWESRTPKFDQEFMRTYDAGVGIPILTHAGVQMTIDSKVSGSIGATIYMDSPDNQSIEGVFQPKVSLSATAGVVAAGPFWSKAAIEGSYTLLDYNFKGAVGLSYQQDSQQLQSFINVENHRINALNGRLSAKASFGPDADSNALIKQFWNNVTTLDGQKRYEKQILKLEGLTKDLDSFRKSRTIFIAEPTSFEECVERSELLVSETKEMIKDLEKSGNSSLRRQASRHLEQAFATIENCKKMIP